MSIISSIQENGGLFRGGLIGALFGKGGGESCAGGSCGASSEASSAGGSSCANGSCSGGSKGPSNDLLALRPGGGCANGKCG